MAHVNNHQRTTMEDQAKHAKPERYLRLPEVMALVGLKKSSIYAGIKATPPTFPAPVRLLGVRAVAWPESSIAKWQSERPQA
jgi:prophage regulatory protein